MKMTKDELSDLIKKEFDKTIEPYLKVKRPTFNDTKDKPEIISGIGKKYKELFGDQTKLKNDFDDLEDFLKAVKGGFDPRLKDLSTLTDAGVLLPDEFKADLLDSSLEDEIVRPRAMSYGLKFGKGKTLKVPAFLDVNHSTSGIAGVEASWGAELSQKDKTEPKFRMVEMALKKLFCYTESSDELIQQSGIPMKEVIGIAFRKAISFYQDLAYLRGDGEGEPLGVLNSGALLVQQKEDEQADNTICFENLIGIFGKMLPGSLKRCVWVASISTLPQLMQITITSESGANIRVMQEVAGRFYMLGREILFTEKVPALGNKGCLGLYDFSAYAVLLGEDVGLESSIHTGFREDKTAWRFVLNVDGQPTVEDTLTCYDGETIVSPFVCLGDVKTA